MVGISVLVYIYLQFGCFYFRVAMQFVVRSKKTKMLVCKFFPKFLKIPCDWREQMLIRAFFFIQFDNPIGKAIKYRNDALILGHIYTASETSRNIEILFFFLKMEKKYGRVCAKYYFDTTIECYFFRYHFCCISFLFFFHHIFSIVDSLLVSIHIHECGRAINSVLRLLFTYSVSVRNFEIKTDFACARFVFVLVSYSWKFHKERQKNKRGFTLCGDIPHTKILEHT